MPLYVSKHAGNLICKDKAGHDVKFKPGILTPADLNEKDPTIAKWLEHGLLSRGNQPTDPAADAAAAEARAKAAKEAGDKAAAEKAAAEAEEAKKAADAKAAADAAAAEADKGNKK